MFISDNSYGQIAAVDTNDLQYTALNKAKLNFNKAIGAQSSLYNGPEYYFYNPTKIRGSAYFQEETIQPGNVCYDGVAYKNIQLVYDVYKDELITLLYNSSSSFSLLKSAVQTFDLLNHHFINIDADTLTSNPVIKGGYYNELYEGKSQVLVKISKIVEDKMSSTGEMEAYYTFSNAIQQFYIRREGIYYKITSESTLLDVLKDKKKKIQQYIKSGKIKFKRDPGQAMASIAAYYDTLNN